MNTITLHILIMSIRNHQEIKVPWVFRTKGQSTRDQCYPRSGVKTARIHDNVKHNGTNTNDEGSEVEESLNPTRTPQRTCEDSSRKSLQRVGESTIPGSAATKISTCGGSRTSSSSSSSATSSNASTDGLPNFTTTAVSAAAVSSAAVSLAAATSSARYVSAFSITSTKKSLSAEPDCGSLSTTPEGAERESQLLRHPISRDEESGAAEEAGKLIPDVKVQFYPKIL